MTNLFHQLHPEILRFPGHHHRVGRSADEDLQVGGRKWLWQIIPGSSAKGFYAAGHAGIAGHHDDDGVLVSLEGGLQNFQPRDLRHVEVDQHDVELPAPHGLQRLFASPDQRDIVAIHLEDTGATLSQGALVIDHQDADAGLNLTRDGERIAGCAIRTGRNLSFGLREGTDHASRLPGETAWAVGSLQTASPIRSGAMADSKPYPGLNDCPP